MGSAATDVPHLALRLRMMCWVPIAVMKSSPPPCRLGKGSGYKGSKLPEKPLVYWGYESSPFCKVCRQANACVVQPRLCITIITGGADALWGLRRCLCYQMSASGFRFPHSPATAQRNVTACHERDARHTDHDGGEAL